MRGNRHIHKQSTPQSNPISKCKKTISISSSNSHSKRGKQNRPNRFKRTSVHNNQNKTIKKPLKQKDKSNYSTSMSYLDAHLSIGKLPNGTFPHKEFAKKQENRIHVLQDMMRVYKQSHESLVDELKKTKSKQMHQQNLIRQKDEYIKKLETFILDMESKRLEREFGFAGKQSCGQSDRSIQNELQSSCESKEDLITESLKCDSNSKQESFCSDKTQRERKKLKEFLTENIQAQMDLQDQKLIVTESENDSLAFSPSENDDLFLRAQKDPIINKKQVQLSSKNKMSFVNGYQENGISPKNIQTEEKIHSTIDILNNQIQTPQEQVLLVEALEFSCTEIIQQTKPSEETQLEIRFDKLLTQYGIHLNSDNKKELKKITKEIFGLANRIEQVKSKSYHCREMK